MYHCLHWKWIGLDWKTDLALTKNTTKNITCRTYRDTALENIQDSLQKALKKDKGRGCKMPYLDPFSKEIMKFNKDLPKVTCPGEDWVQCYYSQCRIKSTILRNVSDVICHYQDIIHISDWKRYLGNATQVTGDKPYILDKSDHVRVECTGTFRTHGDSFTSNWVGYSVGFRKSVERKPVPPNREDTLNVLMFGFDSTSKNNFIRNMPRSYHYLKSYVGATILNSYNIVGDATAAALFPLLTGKTELEQPDVRTGTTGNHTLDSMPFIFYKLKEDGYRTAYFEDMQWIGTFQHRFKGFLKQPADHYLRSFYLEESKQMNKSEHCVGDTPQYQLMINITDQFLRLDGKRFCFTFIGDITHDDFNLISTADDSLLQLLQSLMERGVFEDTLFILMGDHGARFAPVRKTYQGKLEERLPLMSIRLPEKLKRKRPEAQAHLEANVDALSTPHDVHATILDVLDWKQYINPYKVPGADLPRAMTLLEPISKNRSCSEAEIEPHWCACVNWMNVSKGSSMRRRTAEAFIHYINELTEPVRSKCVPRTLTDIQWVMSQRPNNRLLSFVNSINVDGYVGKFGANTVISRENYQIRVGVGPGYGTYEAMLTYIRKEDRFQINSRDISRTNAYGDEPSCISATHPHLDKFCYCKDYFGKSKNNAE